MSASILVEAEGLINGPRAASYGHAFDNFGAIADVWNWWLAFKVARGGEWRIEPEDVGVMMTLLKLARNGNAPKRDNLVDAAGYLGCVEQVELERVRRNAIAAVQSHTVEPSDFTVYETPRPAKATNEVAHCRECGSSTFFTVDKCDTCARDNQSPGESRRADIPTAPPVAPTKCGEEYCPICGPINGGDR